MSTQSNRDLVAKIKHTLEGFGGTDQAAALTEELLAIPAPAGNADGVAEWAGQFSSTASSLTEIQVAVHKVSDNVPTVWVGVAANKATEVIAASFDQTGRSAGNLVAARFVLNKLGDAFAEARTAYNNAQDPLHTARNVAAAGPFEQVRARDLAIEGATQLLRAFDTVLAASRDAVRDLHTLTADARASQLPGGSLTSADRLVLAAVRDPVDPNWILTQAEATRAAQQRDALPPEERRRFDALLAAAKSPHEKAYLFKALATGDGMAVVERFAYRIHEHGDDPTWLHNHLSPSQIPQATPERGTEAMDIIHARAAIDPNYALHLIAGHDPTNPHETSTAAMTERLEAEQHRVGSEPNDTLERTREVGHSNGTTYQHHEVGAGERAALLDDVQRATDEGKTVFVHTSDGHEGIVVDHEGGALQVRDVDSGTTTWISEQTFVEGHLPGAAEDIDSVDLPT